MANAFYKELIISRKNIEKMNKEVVVVQTVRDNLEHYDNNKYVAAISNLKQDIEDLSFWSNIITYAGIMITILVSAISPEDSTIGAVVMIALVIAFTITLLALKRWGLRSKYIKLLTVLENSKEYINKNDVIEYNFEIEIDDKIVGKLILKEEK